MMRKYISLLLFIVIARYAFADLPKVRVLEWTPGSVVVEALCDAVSVSAKTAYGTAETTVLSSAKLDVGVYLVAVHDADLIRDAGQQLSLTFKDAGGKTVYSASFTIPVIIVGTDTLSNYDVYTCSQYDIVVPTGSVLRIDPNAETYTVPAWHIYGGGRLVVPAGADLQAGAVYMYAGSLSSGAYRFVYPQLFVDGSLVNTTGTVIYDYLLSNKQYYSISLPASVSVSDIAYADGNTLQLGKSFFIVDYDGSVRAAGGNGWGASATDSLYRGIGYTIAAAPQYVRIGSASPLQQNYTYIRFPLKIELSHGDPAKDILIPVSAYPAQTGQDNDAGWNLVGNPYLADYIGSVSGLTNNGIGLLVTDGSEYSWEGTLRYVVIPSDDGRSYTPMLASAATLPAFKNFFVQIGTGDALSFLVSNRRANMPSWLLDADEVSADTLLILSLSASSFAGGNNSDKVGILVGHAYTDTYEINADLDKFARNAGVNAFISMQSRELSFAAVDSTSAVKGLAFGYALNGAGQYTIALDSLSHPELLNHVWLYDNLMHTYTDLLEGACSFTVTADELEQTNRFVVSLSYNRDYLPSSIDNVLFSEPPYKILYKGQLYMCKGGKYYSVHGALLNR